MRFHHKARWGSVAACLAVTMSISGCDWSNMAFVQDKRVRIIEPPDRSTVSLPIRLRWEVEGFRITGPDGAHSLNAGYFAVFVDRTPMPPGKSLQWLAEQEDSCGTSACGSVENLADVYATTKTTLTLTRLPADSRPGGAERHEAMIVLLDGTGRRIGESAFYVRFNFERTV